MRLRRASPFGPSSAAFRRSSMSAKPNWRPRRFSSAMRRAMLAAACRYSACDSGSIALSASHRSVVTSKLAGTSATKPLLQASMMPSGVRRCHAVSVMSGISITGSSAHARSASNHLTSESARSLFPLKHFGATSRWPAIHASIWLARSNQPCLSCSSCTRCSPWTLATSLSSGSSGEGPRKSTRRTRSRTDCFSTPTSGQHSSRLESASLLSG